MSGISSGRASPVVHHIPMTNRVGTAEVANGGAENGAETTGNGADMATAVPAISFGAWPSPITAADVARSQLRLAYPIVTRGEGWVQETPPEAGRRGPIGQRT